MTFHEPRKHIPGRGKASAKIRPERAKGKVSDMRAEGAGRGQNV